VQPLPSRITAAQLHALPAFPAGSPAHASGASGASGLSKVGHADVLIGVGGDELSPVSFRIPVGGVVAVLGAPGSGKTNALQVFQALNPARPWVSPDAGRDADGVWKQALAMARSGRLPQDAVLLADDADLLSPPAMQDLAELQAMGQPLVLTANYSPALLQRVPLVMASRAGGTGLLLCPRSTSDGDVFGVRFEVETGPPPGRAVLISGGRSSPIQVALAVPDP
jgi:S-DNA-T family DNA segregation ATPase FtsK/SpoIIIE